MNKPYFCLSFFLTDWRHKRLINTIDLLLFYGEDFYGISETDLEFTVHEPVHAQVPWKLSFVEHALKGNAQFVQKSDLWTFDGFSKKPS